METFDVVVAGLGAAGAATANHLARAGARVLGIDPSTPNDTLGSSRGETKITRLAVGEGPAYLPLVARSHELWRELESETDASLLVQCGGLVMGVAGATGHHGVDDFVGATIGLADDQGIAHDVLDADEIRERFGVFGVTSERGYYEPTAGLLRAAACVAAQRQIAERRGATIHTGERVTGWLDDGAGVRVTTDHATYSAGRLVVAAGPWVGTLVPELAHAFTVQRQVTYWFDVADAIDRYERLPVFIWMHGDEPGAYLYGFPPQDGPHGGVKVAAERFDAPTTADGVDRAVSDAEIARMYDTHVAGRFAGLGPRCIRADVCCYTMTSDFSFVIDTLPGHDRVLVVSACSGHGFKHSAAVGESAAALALGTAPVVDVSAFRLDRFS